MKISVFAAGAWGTAVAASLSARHTVCLWSREAEVVADIQATRENRRFLPGHRLPEALLVTHSFDQAVDACALAIVATPLAGLRETVSRLASLQPALPLLWLCKGVDPATGKLPHELVEGVMAADTPRGVLSGPSFAHEVAAGLPTALTLASCHADFSETTARTLHSARLRIYSSDDVIGVEVGGAVKNVMAIASGICDGMHLGHNARAALITRGLAEISRLGAALGARSDTFMGLTGLGDLVLTCTGDLSRNRRVGLELAKGRTCDDIVRSLGHVAEGVPTARAVRDLARARGVDMPITGAVARVLFEDMSAQQALAELLERDPKPE